MDHQDGTVPGPRRAPRSRRRTPGPSAEPRVADLSALLADIDALRTTLSTDLSLAAAALESGADDLAAELVGSDLDEVRAFEARALRHLASLDALTTAPDPVAVGATPAVDDPIVVPLRRRRLLAAAPLLAAAAAAAALFAGVVPSSTPAPGPSESATELSRAGFSLATLSELAEQGASTAELRAAAVDLNAELTELVAGAGADPLAARQALLLVQASTQVLTEQADGGVLSEVLARTRELERALRQVLPVPAVPLPVVPPLPVPVEAVVRPSPTQQPVRPAGEPSSSPAAPTRTAPASASPRPAGTQSSTTQPSPTQPSGTQPSSTQPSGQPAGSSPTGSPVDPFASGPALGG